MEQARKRALVEKRIYSEGRGRCANCDEEIWNNPVMSAAGWTWESEEMVGWCESSKDKKHHPQIIVEDV